jgi:four helix bundle protein
MGHNLKRLKIWNDAVDLAVDVYKETNNFPKEEKFGLSSQINRSAVSIASNIAEGAGRNNSKEFNQFLGVANGSINELWTQLIIATRVGLLSEEKLQHYEERIDKTQRSIYNFKQTIKTKTQSVE